MKVRFGIVALAAASLAACGGGGSSAQPAASPVSTAPAAAAPSASADAGRNARPAKRKTAQVAPPPPANQGIELTVRPGARLQEIRTSLRRLLASKRVERQQRVGGNDRPSRFNVLPKPAKGKPKRSDPNAETVLERIAQGKSPLPAG